MLKKNIFNLLLVIFIFILDRLSKIIIIKLSEPLGELNISITSYAYYLRSYQREPLLLVSIINACTILTTIIIFLPMYGLNGLIYSFGMSTLCIGFFGARRIFNKFYYAER